MTLKAQNVISNIAGIILVAVAIYRSVEDNSIYVIAGLYTLGFWSILFRVSQTKLYLQKVFNSLFSGGSSRPETQSTIGSDLPPPEEEEEPV